jgi:hypothetical protein
MNWVAVPARCVFAAAAIAACATAQKSAGPCAPYSAEQDTQLIRTLANGTHITSPPIKTIYYRDSEGRERTESTISDYPGLAPILFT